MWQLVTKLHKFVSAFTGKWLKSLSLELLLLEINPDLSSTFYRTLGKIPVMRLIFLLHKMRIMIILISYKKHSLIGLI